jgi:hemerythrin-like metal-binding protein
MKAQSPTLVTWQDTYSIGLPEVDDQHKMLFALINRLWVATIARAERSELLGIVEELENYTRSHFAAEEAFMRAIRYARRAEHEGMHRVFVGRISVERAAVDAGKLPGLDLLRFLNDWLVNHILVTDKEYAAAYREIARPASPLTRFFRRLRG